MKPARLRSAPTLLIFVVLGCGEGGGAISTVSADTAPGAPDGARAADDRGAATDSRGAGQPIFVDATASSGLDFVHRNGMEGDRWFVEIMGSGAALFDHDDDGDLDLFLVQGGSLEPGERADETGDRLYRNDLAAGAVRFVDVTAESGIAESGYGMGVATGDYDGDGRVDLYVTNWGANELWRNRGGGAFERRGAAASVDDPRWSVAAVFFDADRDGRLDLFVGNYVDFTPATHKRCLSALGVPDYCGPLTFEAQPDVLYRNRGDGTFADASGAAGLRAVPARPALGALAGDFDADGWLDLYVANDQTANDLWRGTGGGRFVEDALASGCAVDGEGKPQASMGVTAGDADDDGDEDLFLTHLTEEHHTLYTNLGKGAFEDSTTRAGLVTPTWPLTGFGVGWIDYDGDGLLDLLSVSGAVKIIPDQVAAGDPLPLRQAGLLVRNQGSGRFSEVAMGSDEPLGAAVVGRGAAFGDVDNDGDTDVVVTANNGPARLLLNQLGNRGPWIGLRAVERVPGGGDRDVLDAWVGVRREGGRPVLWRRARTAGSYASASDPRLLFGLGAEGAVVGVDVRWPDGTTESWGALEPGRYHALRRGEGSVMRRLTIVVALLWIAVASCRDRGEQGSLAAAGTAKPARVVEVPHPDLAAVSADLRTQIAELRELVESSGAQAAGSGDAEAEKLGQAWGDLARAYHAYGFLDAAATAYDNASALQPEIAGWSYLAGLLEVQRGRHDVAVERFRRALEIDPELVVARLRLGLALLDLGRAEEAVPELEAAAKSPAHAAAALAALGRAANDGGDAARARDLFERALAAQPNADLLHHSIGLAYRGLGDEARAKEELSRAGTTAPVFPDPAAVGLDELRTTTGALLLRGSRALVTEHPREAVAQYRRAVTAAPDDVEARRSLALALRATGDLDGALAELEEAARLEPRDHVVRFDLGNVQLARGAQQAAADAFAASLEVAPDFVPARFNLANAQLMLGQANEALANLERVIELDPGHRRARYQAAMAKAAAGRNDEAMRDLDALLAADPGFGAAMVGLAGLRGRGGDLAGARAAYEEAVRASSEIQFRVEGHLGLAGIAREEGRPEVEIEHLRAAVELAPDRDDLREGLARALESARRFAEAAEERRALVELRPRVVMDRLLEATAWVQAGRSDLARERLEEGVERLPGERHLSNSLARLLATAPEPAVRDGARALELARQLYAADPSPDVTETLAMALAESGDYEQAISVQRGLIAQVKTAGQTGHLPRLEANLQKFERNQPVRM